MSKLREVGAIIFFLVVLWAFTGCAAWNAYLDKEYKKNAPCGFYCEKILGSNAGLSVRYKDSCVCSYPMMLGATGSLEYSHQPDDIEFEICDAVFAEAIANVENGK